MLTYWNEWQHVKVVDWNAVGKYYSAPSKGQHFSVIQTEVFCHIRPARKILTSNFLN